MIYHEIYHDIDISIINGIISHLQLKVRTTLWCLVVIGFISQLRLSIVMGYPNSIVIVERSLVVEVPDVSDTVRSDKLRFCELGNHNLGEVNQHIL